MGLFSLMTTVGSVGTSVTKSVLNLGSTALKCGKKLFTSGIGKIGLVLGGVYLLNHNNSEVKAGITTGFSNLLGAIGGSIKGVAGRMANVTNEVAHRADETFKEETAGMIDESKLASLEESVSEKEVETSVAEAPAVETNTEAVAEAKVEEQTQEAQVGA